MERLFAPNFVSPRTTRLNVKIATFNVNGIRGRLPRLLAWLAKARPDVVCLQEIRTPQASFPRLDLLKAGYASVWIGEKSFNGVAILAREREPVLIRNALPGDPSDMQSRYIEAAVGGIVIGCIYLPNGNPQPGPRFDYKLAWFERLIAHARTLKRSGAPVVLAGDFNVVPTEHDIYSTTSYDDDALVQPESRAAFQRLLRQGWIDSIRRLHPDDTVYTFWDYMRKRWQRNAGLRIDHLMLSPDLESRLTSAGVDRWVRGEPGASDHAPAWIEIAVLTSPRKRVRKAARKQASRSKPRKARRLV